MVEPNSSTTTTWRTPVRTQKNLQRVARVEMEALIRGKNSYKTSSRWARQMDNSRSSY